MRVPLPGLWAWEESSRYNRESSTLLWDAYEREIQLLYVFPQLATPDGMQARHGLVTAVSGAIKWAISVGYHAAYGFDGDAPGTPLWKTLGLVDLSLDSTSYGRLAQTPGSGVQQGGRAGSEGYTHRFFPAVRAKLSAIEHVVPIQIDGGTDQADGTLTIDVEDGQDPNALEILERVIVSPHDQP
jgi:hypothetical protein